MSIALILTFSVYIPAGAIGDYNGNILGSYADENDRVEAGLEVYEGGTHSTWQLLTMSASKVTNFLSSKSSGKSFRRSDLSHGGLLIQGTLSYSVTGTTYPARGGVCTYTSDQGFFVATHEVEGNVIFSIFDQS